MANNSSEKAGVSNSHPVLKEAIGWLDSSRGKAQARSLSARIRNRYGFPYDPEELRVDALCALWDQLGKTPDLYPESIGAYCTSIMKNLCNRRTRLKAHRDLLQILDQLEELVEMESSDELVEIDGVSSGIASYPAAFKGPLTNERPAHDQGRISLMMRAAIETVSGSSTQKAAVLNFLTLSSYPEIDCAAYPKPKQGSNSRQQVWWPSLFLATQDPQLFPVSGHEEARHRQRRKRFMTSCEEILAQARRGLARAELKDV